MSDLILVPTAREMDRIKPELTGSAADFDLSFQRCGFGPIAAAARTAALLTRYQPERVLLIGIAGSFVDEIEIGSAYRFDQVACDGIGVGVGDEFRSAEQLGWHQFCGDQTEPRMGDLIQLDSAYVGGFRSSGMLLTCCAASANRRDADRRREQYPAAVAEDMEGFAVAMACSLARVPLQIVRGISNHVGDRDSATWQIDESLAAACRLASQLIPLSWMPTP